MESSYQGGVSLEDSSSKFQQLSQTITSNIKKISQNVSSMSKMVNQLQTPQDSQELRNQLRQIQNYTQKLVKDTSALIMEMMKLPVEQPTQRIVRERLSDEYMATLNAFQSTQRTAAQKTKEDVRKVKAQSFKIGDPFAMGSGSSRDPQLLEMDETTTQKQEQMTMQTERELQELEEREQDIRQLESDIMDVNQIFKELGQMIHDQGAVVDSIESSVEHASQNVEAGAQELHQAVNYKPVPEQVAEEEGILGDNPDNNYLDNPDPSFPQVILVHLEYDHNLDRAILYGISPEEYGELIHALYANPPATPG
ncbi:syntaxin-7 isoform X1 [Hyposmocoma kahamanoa]|uniref:syntaxin-7 isoform X1 n=1 Tax=Hyposmocoma kahamanoa TaxID=1477025 RepID=UPI000E6D7601|nr:syntaxin-7 isoform X1 [Hyposmocoma kahamanoa]